MKADRTAALVGAIVALATQAGAQSGLLVPTSTGHPDARVLAVREMAIDVGIARGYARVNVRQVFENRTPESQEATYRFRLPPGPRSGISRCGTTS